MAVELKGVVPSNYSNPSDITSIDKKNVDEVKEIANKSAQIARFAISSFPGTRSLSWLNKTVIVVGYGISGLAIGAALGGIVAMSTSTLNPISAIPCTAAGTGLGGLMGFGFGGYKIYEQKRDEFSTWRKAQIKKILEEFENKLHSHDALKRCEDPITFEPMEQPSHCSCSLSQHTYDYSTFATCEQEQRPCPSAEGDDRKKIIALKDIRIDYLMKGVISREFSVFLQAVARAVEFSDDLIRGIQLLTEQLDTNYKMFLKQEMDDLGEKIKNEASKKRGEIDNKRLLMLVKKQIIAAGLLLLSQEPGGQKAAQILKPLMKSVNFLKNQLCANNIEAFQKEMQDIDGKIEILKRRLQNSK